MSKGLIPIAKVGELKPNEMQAFEVAGKRLLLVFAQDEYFVVDEMCSHEDYSLALGCIKNQTIKCSLHGSYFDLHTGSALDEPADEPIGCYAVEVKDGVVYVAPGVPRG